jgi:ABC-type phosphate transport system substrate-binding protein
VTASGGDCRDFSVGQLAFSAPQVNYIGTDSPITSTDYASFNSNRASATAIVQFPTLAGSIALPFQHSGFSGTLNLSVAQVCGIFRGTINNWSTLGLPAKTIKIVYRTDNSGTSFAFTNFLAARCNAPNGGPIANRPDGTAYWQTNQGYAASVPSLPAGAIGSSGNNNVVAAVFNPLNDGAIGYADPGDVLATTGAKWALVNSADPMSFTLPPLANADLQVGQVMSPTGSTMNGLPSLSAAPTGAANLPSLLVVRPNLAVTSGYPIFAVTYLGAAKTSNGATNAPALRCLGHFIYNHSGVAGCTLGRPIPSSLPAGYSYIDDSVLAVRTKLNTAINSIAP